MIRRGNEFDHTVLGPGVRMLCAGLGVLAVAGSVQAGAQWTLYEGDFAGWQAAVSSPQSYTFAGTGLPYQSHIGALYAEDGIMMESCHGITNAGTTAPVLLDASYASDPDGFAVRFWGWGFYAIRFRFETPIRAIWLDTGGWSESTGAWSEDGSISGFVNDASLLNHGFVFDVPVSTVVIATEKVQNLHVEFVPAPGVLPAMFFGVAGLLRSRRR